MASISFIFPITFLLLFHPTRSSNPNCQKRYCGAPETVGNPFEFPFLLRETNDTTNNESIRCGYPGFDVLCNENKQALLKLSTAGEFVITYTSLETQRIWINDPNECLPRRFLQNIDLQDSPFKFYYTHMENITFFNCTRISGETNPRFDDLPVIACLSNSNEYLISYALQPFNWKVPSSCREIGFASVPVKDNSRQSHIIRDGLYSDIVLQWDTPQCNCQVDQFCGFLTDYSSDVTCYNKDKDNIDLPGGNLPTPRHKSVYFFPIVWGISGLLFFIWVILSVCKDKQQQQQQHQHHQQIQQSQANIEPTNRESPWYVLGLDRSRIEQFPKIQLAESGTLPKSIDNVCSICLSEYKPMETLRSMPQCNHHFHVDCIDVWLKMNATCPLCRNLPEGEDALVIFSLPPTILHQPSSS